MKKTLLYGLLLYFGMTSCERKSESDKLTNGEMSIEKKVSQYVKVRLGADVSHLSDQEKKMIPLLIEAADLMDDIFWQQAYGDKEVFLKGIEDIHLKRYAEINYGAWDRMDGLSPFIQGYGPKPAGANFYPADMTKEEFEKFDDPLKSSQYTLIRRDERGNLMSVPYRQAYSEQIEKAAALLVECAWLAEDEGLKNYLLKRADAFRTDEYFESDMVWMDMKQNTIDVVIGPIENYEDRLFNYKAAHEAFILIKDKEWSDRLSVYAGFLPELQKRLPVDEIYKSEKPGTDADLNAYEVIYYAGDCNSGGKTIAINLPNDERVQLEKGSRRLQLKNAMKAKFDNIMLPISELLIHPDQQKNVSFDAFFSNVMFHEVAHGLGIKNTISGKGTVRSALKEHYSSIEESKADILGLFLISQLIEMNHLEGDLADFYTTFMAGIFRSVRFGASSAHGKANMICFNYFRENGAFSFDETTQTYTVNVDEMDKAIRGLSEMILVIQGNGSYEEADALLKEKGIVDQQLRSSLAKISASDIPIDVVFEQGLNVLKF
ncbi:MAG: Zn-dependent hydrolase [Cyclobacteriaceae bacterium]|nr:Zn-dependent hydrolase [Cyclobacteriaceae bacterium]